MTRSKSAASLDGRIFCQFVAYGYEAFFQNALNSLRQTLAVATGDPTRDKSDVFRKEKKLLSWLNGMSVAKLFDWFDATQETTVHSNIGKARWRTESVERDQLLLARLGVLRE